MSANATKQSEADVLKAELVGLFKHIQKIRVEIAMIKSPKNDHFSTMTDELDSIVEATQSATDEIMNNVERVNDIAFSFSEKYTEAADKEAMNEIIDRVTNVIVACSFQDITGQRIQKIVKAIKYIEGHINSLISIWGQDVINEQKVERQTETDEYKKYLNGPQLKGQGIDQNEIDAMLGNSGMQSSTSTLNEAPSASSNLAAAIPAKSEIPQSAAPQALPQKTASVASSAPAPAVQTKPASAPAVAAKPASNPAPAVAAKDEAPVGPALDQNSIDALFD